MHAQLHSQGHCPPGAAQEIAPSARHERRVKGALHAGDLERQLLDLLHTGRPQQPAQEGAPALAGAAGNAAAPGGGAALHADPAVAALQQTRDRLRQLADALTGGAPSSEAAPQAASPSAGQQQQELAAQQQQSQAPAAGTDVTATPQPQQPAAPQPPSGAIDEMQLRAALGRSMPPAGGLAGDGSPLCRCIGQKCSACGTACEQQFCAALFGVDTYHLTDRLFPVCWCRSCSGRQRCVCSFASKPDALCRAGAGAGPGWAAWEGTSHHQRPLWLSHAGCYVQPGTGSPTGNGCQAFPLHCQLSLLACCLPNNMIFCCWHILLLLKQQLHSINAAPAEHQPTALQQEAPPAAEAQPGEEQDMGSDEEMDDAEDMSEHEGSLEPEPPEVSCRPPESSRCHRSQKPLSRVSHWLAG